MTEDPATYLVTRTPQGEAAAVAEILAQLRAATFTFAPSRDAAEAWGRMVLAFLDLTGRSFESITIAELRELSEAFQQ